VRILYIEPFNAGSHAAFTRALTQGLDHEWTTLTLPGRHWKWRMRGSAAWAASELQRLGAPAFDVVFASAYLPLAELGGLVPSLAPVPKILYFHENQLAFPVRPEHTGERDQHFGFTQLTSALAADAAVFNSEHNRRSFLDAGRSLLAAMPDAVPAGWCDAIEAKSRVLPLPLELPEVTAAELSDLPRGKGRAQGPLILWNHRWEHDKGPDPFFEVLFELAERRVPFRLAVCGKRFRQAPPIFEAARERLRERIHHFGPIDVRDEYLALLGRAQLAVSTARHEFFGVSMIEAAHLGARPLVPDRLAYPELFPADLRHADDAALPDLLEGLCHRWVAGEIDLRADRRDLTGRFAASAVLPSYDRLLRERSP
jgi:glycosyltransferase involved in cell wall biosynthesis